MKLTYRGLSYAMAAQPQEMEATDRIASHQGRQMTFQQPRCRIPDTIMVLQYRGLSYLRWGHRD